jgi:hypoxanthine phosphoribosyltransferase
MNTGVTGVLSDLDRVLLDEDSLRQRVKAMAAEVQRDHPGQTLTVLAIMDGALFFVADLLRCLDLPVRIVTMSASSYHGGTKSSGSVRLPWPDDLQLAGAHVLVLDDILDTGLTLAAVRERLLAEQPASLRIGVLLKKRRVQEKEVPTDYVGFEIEDEFVVGYGMDYQGKFRNLPCIGILRL